MQIEFFTPGVCSCDESVRFYSFVIQGEGLMKTTLKFAAILTALCMTAGCGKTLQGQVPMCREHAETAKSHATPENEEHKRAIEKEGELFFYRCMKDAGFSEKKNFDDEMMNVIKRDYPNASEQEKIARLNEMRSKAMYQTDPATTLWEPPPQPTRY
jgi:hypothetical protein